jgi:hypothetical protein
MSRIFRSTDTSVKPILKRPQPARQRFQRLRSPGFRSGKSLSALTVTSLAVLIALTACTPVRPVAKVGLIAPFEGLYRETGYALLDAVRRAIEDCAPGSVDVLPLAVDDSALPAAAARSAQKLLTDPAVSAVIGPFSLDTIAAVTPLLERAEPTWIVPTAVDRTGNFAAMGDSSDWLLALVVDAANLAAAEGARVFYVAGASEPWTTILWTQLEPDSASIPLEIMGGYTDLIDMPNDSALLWLGSPHLAASVQAELHGVAPEADFWLGPYVDSPVFSAHGDPRLDTYWLTWVPLEYNSTSRSAPGSLTAELTYAATCQAVSDLSRAGMPGGGDHPASLQLTVFRIEGVE